MSFNDAISDSDLTTEEFETAFKSLKRHKAAGIDTIYSNIGMDWGKWPSGSRRCNENRKVSVQTSLITRPGLGTQLHYETHGDLRVKLVQTH